MSKHEYKTREPGLPISDFWLFLIYLLIYSENVYGHSSHSWWLPTAYKNKTPVQKPINPYTYTPSYLKSLLFMGIDTPGFWGKTEYK